MIEMLPTLNATLNAIAGIFLVAGYICIRTGRPEAHKRLMIAAFSTSALFLVSYVIYHAMHGSTRYTGTGPMRVFYFSVLITHVVLAIFVAAAAPRVLYLGLRDRLAEHKRLARWTFPIWVYVSITGVVVYWMLYRS